MANGDVFCGYIKSIDRDYKSLVLYHPYIEAIRLPCL